MLMEEILHNIEKHHWHLLGRHNYDGISNRFWESRGGNRTIAKEASQHRGGGKREKEAQSNFFLMLGIC